MAARRFLDRVQYFQKKVDGNKTFLLFWLILTKNLPERLNRLAHDNIKHVSFQILSLFN